MASLKAQVVTVSDLVRHVSETRLHRHFDLLPPTSCDNDVCDDNSDSILDFMGIAPHWHGEKRNTFGYQQ